MFKLNPNKNDLILRTIVSKMNPSLELVIGPMFSGKTTELFRCLTTYSNANLNVLYVNSTLDSRGENMFSTHNSSLSEKQTIPMVKTTRLVDIFDSIKNVDVIGIDEAQFFEDLVEFCTLAVEKHKKSVIVSGLNGTSDRTTFGAINLLIPLCDNVIFLRSFCHYCAKEKKIVHAPFSKRIVDVKSTVCVGGVGKYVPTCRSHFET